MSRNLLKQLPKLRAVLAAGMLLGSALLIALVIAAVIKTIQQDADRWRQGQIILMHLEKDVYLLNRTETETFTDPSLLRSDVAGMTNLEDQAQQHLQEIQQLRNTAVNGPGATGSVESALHLYLDSVRQEMQLFASQQGEKARIWHEATVAPAHDALSDALLDAGRDYDKEAMAANKVADTGTTAVLLIAAMLLSALVWRAQRVQRANTQLAAGQEALQQSERRFQALIRNASDVIAIVDEEGRVRYLSAAARHLWGYAPEDLEGTSLFSLIHSDEAGRPRALLAQSKAEPGSTLTGELRLRYADDSWHLCETFLTNQCQEPGIGGFVLTCRDITERKAFEEQLAHQAFHDSLTQLPNRALFMERLKHALARAVRQRTPVGVIFLDLDNFKVVNDSLGHEAGDHLLKTVSERLLACLRSGDTVARLGGDEFTILLEDLADEHQAAGLVERIERVLEMPVLLEGREVFTTGSLGVAVTLGDGRTPDELLRDADTAMYEAKTSGKACSVLFDASMNTQALERLDLEMDLRRALDNNEFRVYYQPIVTLNSNKVCELEALVRWEHPTRGLVSPARFIPLAEETGMIVPLGRWVLREACRQAHAWQQQCPGQSALTISVNVSPRQLQQPDLVAQVSQILAETGLSASSLKLEITESAMMRDSDLTIPHLHELKALGIRLAVDDFGTGYSSMAYLSSLPIDTLKIDRSFVSKMCEHEEDAAIVRAIVTLAKTLNLRITSEGIETLDQLHCLNGLGCEQGQGYHFSRPLPAEAICDLLAEFENAESTEVPVLEISKLIPSGYNNSRDSHSPTQPDLRDRAHPVPSTCG